MKKIQFILLLCSFLCVVSSCENEMTRNAKKISHALLEKEIEPLDGIKYTNELVSDGYAVSGSNERKIFWTADISCVAPLPSGGFATFERNVTIWYLYNPVTGSLVFDSISLSDPNKIITTEDEVATEVVVEEDSIPTANVEDYMP